MIGSNGRRAEPLGVDFNSLIAGRLAGWLANDLVNSQPAARKRKLKLEHAE